MQHFNFTSGSRTTDLSSFFWHQSVEPHHYYPEYFVMGNSASTDSSLATEKLYQSAVKHVQDWLQEAKTTEDLKLAKMEEFVSNGLEAWASLGTNVTYLFIGLGVMAVICIALVIALFCWTRFNMKKHMEAYDKVGDMKRTVMPAV